MNQQLSLFFFIGLVFSPFAALIAFLITYDEMAKHVGKKKGLRHGLEMAAFTFFVFLVLALVAGYFFSQAIK